MYEELGITSETYVNDLQHHLTIYGSLQTFDGLDSIMS